MGSGKFLFVVLTVKNGKAYFNISLMSLAVSENFFLCWKLIILKLCAWITFPYKIDDHKTQKALPTFSCYGNFVFVYLVGIFSIFILKIKECK